MISSLETRSPGRSTSSAENVERPPADRYRRENTLLIPPEQDTAAPVEAETLEEGNIGRGECVHSCASRAARNFLKF